MKRELKNALGRTFITIEYDSHNHWVYNNWVGYQTFESIIKGANECLGFFETHSCSYLLNDNREVLGPWNHAVEWIATDWTPRAIASGLRCFAHVVSQDSLAKISSEEMKQTVDGFQMQIFGNINEARDWLHENIMTQMHTYLPAASQEGLMKNLNHT